MEEWRDIKGYEELYQISSKWRIKSLPKKWSWGHNWKVLSIWKTKFWYWNVILTRNKSRKNVSIHRLVAQAFLWLDINNHKILVCHKVEDLIKGFIYNWEDNLFLWTAKDNLRDMKNKWRSYFQQTAKKLIKEWHSIEKFDRYDNYEDQFTLY